MEFTIERGKLWMLQTRTGKRTAKAALKIAVDMAEEGLISREEAVMRSTRRRSTSCCTPPSIRMRHRDVIASGLPASPGRGDRRDRVHSDEAVELPQGRPQGHPGPGRPAPRTFTACTPPRASSPRAAA
jgi:pyruvate,orthophosphate dikinase